MNQKTLIFFVFLFYVTSEMSWRQIFAISGLFVVGFLYLIYKQQEKILYLNETITPKRTGDNPPPYANPRQHDMEYSDIWLTTPDAIKLHCWWIPQSNSKAVPTIIFFHANAGNMGFRLPNLKLMHARLKANLFVLSYRGYGESEGIPEEEGLKIDSQTAFEHVVQRTDVDPSQIFIFGRSLGGAVAIYVASENANKISGLILENTFTCISDMVGKVFPFLDFEVIKKYMLRIHWRSIDRIGSVTCPILFLAGDKDEIVPHTHMLSLHDAATSSSSRLMHVINGGTHNEAWMMEGERYWWRMNNFIRDCISGDIVNQDTSASLLNPDPSLHKHGDGKEDSLSELSERATTPQPI